MLDTTDKNKEVSEVVSQHINHRDFHGSVKVSQIGQESWQQESDEEDKLSGYSILSASLMK